METARGTVYAAVAIITVVTLVSGPLVGAVDLTDEPDAPLSGDPGSGNATVSVTAFPDRVSITAGRYGSSQYFLRVPEATVNVSDIEGQPFLVYDISIEELTYSTSTTLFLDAEYAGPNTLTIEKRSFDPEEIDRQRYNATLSIRLRGDGNETVVRQEQFVVEVEE